MRIAVTYENGRIFQHFGHTERFRIYDVTDGQITASHVVDTNGSGHGALASQLVQRGVDVLICGGIGQGARNALAQAGVSLYGGVTGDADEAVKAFLSGELSYDPDARCDHNGHHHGDEHNCKSHGKGCSGSCHSSK